jgi:catechol 2,3-dioxygenase-like lactoylglutathione lyase family enzyme
VPEISGVSHIDLTVTDLDRSLAFYTDVALEEWERHLDERGVSYTPIAEAPYGSVLVFRDPDNIQLELLSNPGT